jgi:23S rRNA (guanosine2251-2'-O)-methyltransferase
VAFVSSITYQPITEIVPAIYELGEVPLILILDGVTDVRNFGAVARTAECAGVHAIVIPEQGAAQINADAMKTSAGALNNIPVSRVKNLNETIDFLKNSGLQMVAATEKADLFYNDINLTVPTAIRGYRRFASIHQKIGCVGKNPYSRENRFTQRFGSHGNSCL